MQSKNYQFTNHVIKTQKANGNIRYILTDYTQNEKKFVITLSTSNKDWRLDFRLDNKPKNKKALSYIDADKNEINIEPNQHPFEQRLFLFENIVDILFSQFISGGIYTMYDTQAPNHIYAISEICVDFINYHVKIGSSTKTLIQYRSVSNYLTLMYGSYTLAEFSKLTLSEVTDKYLTLADEKKWGITTKKTYKRVLVAINNWLIDNIDRYNFTKEIKNNFRKIKINGIDLPKKNVAFTDSDFALIINHCRENKHLKALYMCLSIMYDTHLRPNKEILRIKIKDIDFVNNTIYVHENHKNKKERICPISSEIIDMILEIIKEKNTTIEQAQDLYLFGYSSRFLYHKRGGETCFIEAFVEHIRTPLGLNPAYGVYSMKHYANIRKYKEGATIQELIKLNAHSSIVTTEKYLRELVRDIHVTIPLGLPNTNPKLIPLNPQNNIAIINI